MHNIVGNENFIKKHVYTKKLFLWQKLIIYPKRFKVNQIQILQMSKEQINIHYIRN